MKNKIMAGLAVILLVLALFQITPNVAPLVFSEGGGGVAYKEVWKTVNVANTHENMTTGGDIKVAVNSTIGLNMAWSTGVTEYFENVSYWSGQGYNTYMEWLNGTITLPYHWGEMDWYVSQGSLTSIGWDQIKYWWDMYKDFGGGVSYQTFMGSTYMADCNLTYPENDPDIIGVVAWNGSNITVKDLVVPANTTIYLVFKIVITQPGGYTFNVTTSNPLLQLSPSSWGRGGVATILVGPPPGDYEYSVIQEAVNAASAGDTILVVDGTYLEALYISKTLTLRAASSPVIKGAGSVTTDYGARDAVIFVENASNVVLEGFDIEGQGLGTINPKNYAVIYENSSGIIRNCTVSPNTIGDMYGVAVAAWVGSDLTVNLSTIKNYGRIGVFYYNNCTGRVYNSTIEGQVYSDVNQVCYGIEVHGVAGDPDPKTASQVTIRGNKIYNHDNTYLPEPSWSSAGIVINGWLGYYPEADSKVIIEENDIRGNYHGIEVVASSLSYAHYNNITGSRKYGVIQDPDYLSNNKTFDARLNWWGNETGPNGTIAYYKYPNLNQTGLGNNVTDYVDFKPWLMRPYPPPVPISELYVSPKLVQCWTGLNKTFQIKVVSDNVKVLYGFEFKLRWDPAFLFLVNASYGKLWDVWELWQNTINNSVGEYYLAVTGKGNVPSFNGNATLATLTFQTVQEAVYPNSITSGLTFAKTTLSRSTDLNETGEYILHLVYDGSYICNYTLPKFMLEQPMYVVQWVPKDFGINVIVWNVVNLTAFNFTLSYDPNLLKLLYNESKILLGTSGGIGWDGNSVFCQASGIGKINGTVAVAFIKFRALGVVWNTVNRSVSCDLEFSSTNLTGLGGNPILHEAVDGKYRYEPLPGDLNMDGEVELTDLVLAALAFGTTYTPPPYLVEDFNRDGAIDILDVIVVARNYGRKA